MLWRNQGGMRVSAQSTTSVARLSGLIKNSLFAGNQLFETLRLEGKDFQVINKIKSALTFSLKLIAIYMRFFLVSESVYNQ